MQPHPVGQPRQARVRNPHPGGQGAAQGFHPYPQKARKVPSIPGGKKAQKPQGAWKAQKPPHASGGTSTQKAHNFPNSRNVQGTRGAQQAWNTQGAQSAQSAHGAQNTRKAPYPGGPGPQNARSSQNARGVPPSNQARTKQAKTRLPESQGLDKFRKGSILEQEKIYKRKRLMRRLGFSFVVFLVLGAGVAVWYINRLDNTLELKEDIVLDLAAAPADGPFYMLLLGSDSREGSETTEAPAEDERSDVMVLVRVDTDNRQVIMLSIPRDTPFTLPDGELVKINEMYHRGGASASIKAVSELTGVSIAHYVETRFSGLEKLVDDLGGIEVKVPEAIAVKDALTGEMVELEAGRQVLDGQQAQAFARARKSYGENQDAKRQDNVRTLVTAILKRILAEPPHKLPGTMLTAAEAVNTDLKTGDLIPLALAFSGGSGKISIVSASGPTSGDLHESGLWLCYENPEGWAAIMAAVDAGEDPTGIDVEETAIIPEKKKKKKAA
ncbi:MAG: LCP family protein [Eggerthellaceae bacterium]|nr:LCP family protein [Eggerthellaceae bacterium]